MTLNHIVRWIFIWFLRLKYLKSSFTIKVDLYLLFYVKWEHYPIWQRLTKTIYVTDDLMYFNLKNHIQIYRTIWFSVKNTSTQLINKIFMYGEYTWIWIQNQAWRVYLFQSPIEALFLFCFNNFFLCALSWHIPFYSLQNKLYERKKKV